MIRSAIPRTKLAPCPFCGSEAMLAHGMSARPSAGRLLLAVAAECLDCDASGPSVTEGDVLEEGVSLSDAATARWNKVARQAQAGRMLGEAAAEVNAREAECESCAGTGEVCCECCQPSGCGDMDCSCILVPCSQCEEKS